MHKFSTTSNPFVVFLINILIIGKSLIFDEIWYDNLFMLAFVMAAEAISTKQKLEEKK